MEPLSRRQALQTLSALGLTGAAATAATAQPEKQPPPPTTPTLRRVANILDVKHAVQTTQPPNLVVTAIGEVPTGGWHDVHLIRREYVTEPADGIWEYDLLAKPPDGPATQVISQVKASDLWQKIDPNKIKGVRVFGSGEGVKTVMFGKKKEG
jgi:hypothetical protein